MSVWGGLYTGKQRLSTKNDVGLPTTIDSLGRPVRAGGFESKWKGITRGRSGVD